MKKSLLTATGRWMVLFGVLLLGSTSLGQNDCTLISSEVVTFCFGVETPIPDPNHPNIVDLYHTDLEVSYEAPGWDIAISYDHPNSPPGGRDFLPEHALLYANENARWVLPSIPPDFEFIGAIPDETFWILPQSQNPQSPALPLGIAAEQAFEPNLCPWDPNTGSAASVDLWFEVQLVDVRGPADSNFSMWQKDSFTPPVVFFSTHNGGITDEDVFHISAGDHVHMNWGFTKQGLYEVDIEVSTAALCGEWLIADLMPFGGEHYRGDCVVDFHDYALLALHWLKGGCGGDPDMCEGADIKQPPNGQVGPEDMRALAEQWLGCAFAGCEPQ